MTAAAQAYTLPDRTPVPLGEQNLCAGIVRECRRNLEASVPPGDYACQQAGERARAIEDVTRCKDGDPITMESGLPFWIDAMQLSPGGEAVTWLMLRELAARHADWYTRYLAYWRGQPEQDGDTA